MPFNKKDLPINVDAIKGFLDKQPLAYDWERMDHEAAKKDAAE